MGTFEVATIKGYKCVFCDALIKIGEEMCYHCGYPIIKKDEVFCGKCNKQVNTNSSSCKDCNRHFDDINTRSSFFNNYVHKSNTFVEGVINSVYQKQKEEISFLTFTFEKFFEVLDIHFDIEYMESMFETYYFPVVEEMMKEETNQKLLEVYGLSEEDSTTTKVAKITNKLQSLSAEFSEIISKKALHELDETEKQIFDDVEIRINIVIPLFFYTWIFYIRKLMNSPEFFKEITAVPFDELPKLVSLSKNNVKEFLELFDNLFGVAQILPIAVDISGEIFQEALLSFNKKMKEPKIKAYVSAGMYTFNMEDLELITKGEYHVVILLKAIIMALLNGKKVDKLWSKLIETVKVLEEIVKPYDEFRMMHQQFMTLKKQLTKERKKIKSI